ncbi:MAG: HlyC/CorC family transporter [Ruminococcaceae bacterium]|nr:HlyC/CorC family transporter [Oscillospiraceae bacterium]
MDPLPYILIMAALILMSAYFSATETAFSSLNRTKVKTMVEKGDKKAKLVLKLSDNYDKLISTILVGNNIVNIAVASIGTILFSELLQDPDLGATVSTIVVTVAVLIFGEVSPKSIAKDAPEKFAMFSAPLIRVLNVFLTPINLLFSLWKKMLAKILRIENDSKMSQEELLMLVDEVEQEGSIDEDEGDLLRNAIEFSEQEAGDILTHRVDLEAVPVDATKEEIAKVFTQTRFSRLLVYTESIDNIIGVIHLKDFFTETGITTRPLDELITKPVFIQKSEKINDLLKILQQNKSHIAVVLDEYGGTRGIVTMEDILEELVGEIWDEHDEVVENFKLISENLYDVDCSADFDDFCEFFNIELGEDDESNALSGWIMEQLDKVPEVNDTFVYKHLTVTVTETDYHRVTKIKCEVSEIEDENAEDEKETSDDE